MRRGQKREALVRRAAIGFKLDALGVAAGVGVGGHAREDLNLQAACGEAVSEVLKQLTGGREIGREELAHHRDARLAAAAHTPLPAMS